MNADHLRDVLRGDRFVTGTEALESTVERARHEAGATTTYTPRRRQWAIAAAAGAGCLALFAFTPPGQATTQWVSDLVTGTNDFEPGQYGYQLKMSTLVGSGELPTGDRYQLRGYVGNGEDGGCVAIVWENTDRTASTCANVPPAWKADAVSEAQVVGRLPEDENNPGASGTFVLTTAPAQSTEVDIRVPASDGVEASSQPARIFPIDGKISDTAGATASVPSVQFVVGYLPPGAGDLRTGPPAEAVALNGDSEIGSAKLGWLSFKPSPDAPPWITACSEGDAFCQTLLTHPETDPAQSK